MKKALLLLLIVPMLFVSCGKSGIDALTEKDVFWRTTNLVVGGEVQDIPLEYSYGGDTLSVVPVWQFKSDNTGCLDLVFYASGTMMTLDIDEMNIDFTFAGDDTSITLSGADFEEAVTATYTIDGSTLKITVGDYVYTCEKVNAFGMLTL